MRLAAVNAISITFATTPLLLLATTPAKSENGIRFSGLPVGEGETAGMVLIPGSAFRMGSDRYRPSAGQPQEADPSAGHVGFGTVLNR